ncbi:hypothetical protein FHR53_002797 [Xanthomonas arboricola]
MQAGAAQRAEWRGSVVARSLLQGSRPATQCLSLMAIAGTASQLRHAVCTGSEAASKPLRLLRTAVMQRVTRSCQRQRAAVVYSRVRLAVNAVAHGVTCTMDHLIRFVSIAPSP